MKPLKSFLTFFLLLVLLSGCSSNADADKTEQELSAQEILKKSAEEMKNMKGYKWKVTAKQDIKAPEAGANATQEVDADVDYINEMTFRSNFQLKAEYGQTRENVAMEMIGKNQILYLKDGYTNKWIKTKMTTDLIEKFLGMDKEYINPSFLLDKMLIDVKDVKLNNQGNLYVLELTLNDSQRIKPYLEYAIKNWEEDPDVDQNKIGFKSFKITLHIQKDFKVSKIDQNVSMNIPLAAGANIDVDQKMELNFQGEIKDITIPSEAESAQEVGPENANDSSDSSSGTYKPGDIFKDLQIDPSFGSGSNNQPLVNPSFGKGGY
jgi:hypothetical protein